MFEKAELNRACLFCREEIARECHEIVITKYIKEKYIILEIVDLLRRGTSITRINILITGGFGNIGLLVVEECLKRGYDVTVFDMPSKKNIKYTKKYNAKGVKVILGNILNYNEIRMAVTNQDIVIHMAAILPPVSEEKPRLCKEVNVNGTINVIKAVGEEKSRPAIIEVSSASVMGHTQDRNPPILPDDCLIASDVYSSTKIDAEKLITESGFPFCILRLSAVIPTVINISSLLSMVKILFDMPLNARCEIVFDVDVAYALVSTAEKMTKSKEMVGVKGFIAGGRKKGCQTIVKEFIKSIFEPIGLQIPEESLFPTDYNSYYLDWYDTENTQDLLEYQRHSIEDWHALIKKKYGWLLPLIPLFRTIALRWLEKKSPRYKESLHKARC